MTEYIDRMEAFLPEFDVATGRTEAKRTQAYNPYTRAWLAAPQLEAARVWRELVPTALALDYLLHPDLGRPIHALSRSGFIQKQALVSPETAIQLRFVHDAIAIRERAVCLEHIVETHLAGSAGGDSLRWLSLASGTARPAVAAAARVREHEQRDIRLVVADLDLRALAHVEEVAREHELTGHVTPVATNVLSQTLAADLAEATNRQEQAYDVVENMGFQEYLPQEGDELGARWGDRLPQASEFARKAFEFVKPGGTLISGNMVWPRPQSRFVFGIVDWPIINARSEESILRIFDTAGILASRGAETTLYRVVDDTHDIHIYDIVAVTKSSHG